MSDNAYWARPWSCRMRTRFHSGTYMFMTLRDALEYAEQQWRNNERDVARYPSYEGLRSDFRAHIEGIVYGVKFDLYSKYFEK